MRPSAEHYFLATVCHTDDYPPLDGTYVNFTYGRPLSLRQVRGFWRKALAERRRATGYRPLGLYVHWPFCLSRCRFCFCDAYAVEKKNEQEAYLSRLIEEIEAFEDLFRGTEFSSIYIGGGTPTYAPAGALDTLLSRIRRAFAPAKGAQFFVEGSPATLSEEKLALLARHGVNRMSMGVQSLEPRVLRAEGRLGQDGLAIEALVRRVKDAGMILNLDVMAGLQGQTPQSLLRDVARVASWKPHMMHLYHFDPRAHVPYSKQGKTVPAARHEQIRTGLDAADRLLRRRGYRLSIENWNTPALEAVDDRQDTEWRRYNSSVLALGTGALSHAFGAGWYESPAYGSAARARASRGTWQGFPFGLDEEMRTYVIRQTDTCGRFSLRGFEELFGRPLSSSPFLKGPLDELVAAGKAAYEGTDCIFRFDAHERLVLLKRFYSPAVTSMITRAYRSRYEAFLRRHRGGGETAMAAELAAAERGRFCSRRYFAPEALA